MNVKERIVELLAGKKNEVEVIDKVAISEQKDHSLEELLVYYMETSKEKATEINKLKSEKIGLDNEIEKLLSINEALVKENKILERKLNASEKKVIKLKAIEKVWKDMVSGLNIVTDHVKMEKTVKKEATVMYDTLDDMECEEEEITLFEC